MHRTVSGLGQLFPMATRALPGISLGHNGKTAFGITIFAIDQEDLYVYETNPANPDEYRFQGDARFDGHTGPVRSVAFTRVSVRGAARPVVPGRAGSATGSAERSGRLVNSELDRYV